MQYETLKLIFKKKIVIIFTLYCCCYALSNNSFVYVHAGQFNYWLLIKCNTDCVHKATIKITSKRCQLIFKINATNSIFHLEGIELAQT